jgi:SAM-dependent methyltransferase
VIVERLRQAASRLRRIWREAITDAEMHFRGYVERRERLRRVGLDDLNGLDVLDVGCGDRAQVALLLAAEGARTVGLDRQPVALGLRRPSMWAALARSEGVLPAFRVTVRDALHTFRYWRRLERRSRRRMPFREVRLVQGDAASLPFADSSFDLVVSSAVWEHLPDVDAATQEVNRVLRDGGLAVIQIALFPALQGGHHAEWHSVDVGPERRIRPWDHLYPDRMPLPTYLNEWRESQYRDVIERRLGVFEWQDGEMRGAEFLTDRVASDLGDFSRRDLLLSSLIAWARKRNDPEKVEPRASGAATNS